MVTTIRNHLINASCQINPMSGFMQDVNAFATPVEGTYAEGR